MVVAFAFLVASALLLAAHIVRAIRWTLLFPPNYLTRHFNLLIGLALGYAVNAIVPFRLGELLRAYFVSERESIRFAYVAATVAAERVADLVVVAPLVLVLAAASGGFDGRMWGLVLTTIVTAAAAVAVGKLVRKSPGTRRAIWRAASIFNSNVQAGIADFFWSFADLLRGGTMLRPRFLAATAAMWALYIASYMLIGWAIAESLADTLYALLGSPLRSVAERVTSSGAGDGAALLAFTVLPILGVLLWGLARQGPAILRLLNATRRYGGLPGNTSLAPARDRFRQEDEYRYFVAALFSGGDQVVTGFGLRAIDDGVVHKLFNGGSDAVTALVEVNEHLLIRKFAVGAPAAKLKVQADWLAARGSELSLVDVVGERVGSEFYRYDMPLVVPANDFYDVIHTQPIDRSEELLTDIIGQVAAFHERTALGSAAPEALDGYLRSKAARNAEIILDFARTVLPEGPYRINGADHHLDEWMCLADVDWLAAQVRDRRTAIIHGDLTIENIIITPRRPSGWYIIDPNPENLFDTPLIDWAKLMQSLHLGYESLNRGTPCSLSEASISLSFTKSHAYSSLHARLERMIEDRLGPDTLREVYFHELINYLRLTPYKIRQNSLKGLTFFACTSLLLRRYQERVA